MIDRLRGIGQDPALLRQTLQAVGAQLDAERSTVQAERRQLSTDLKQWNDDVRGLLGQMTDGSCDDGLLGRLADGQERIRHGEQRGAEIRDRLQALDHEQICEADVEAALASFDPLWAALTPDEQARIIRLLVNRVDYDGAGETVTITFEAAGIQALAAERHSLTKEQSA